MRRSLLARVWVPIFAIAGLLLVPPGASWSSTYGLRWLAAGLVLVAAIGRSNRGASVAAGALSIAGALFVAGTNLVRLAAGGSPARWCVVAGAGLVIAIAVRRLWSGLPRDPLQAVAVQLAVGITAQWAYFQVSGLALDYRAYRHDPLQELGGTELSLVAIAFAATGLGVYRAWGPAVERLGWTVPAWWQVVLALLLSQLLLLSAYPANIATYLLMPKALSAIAATSDHVFGGNPWWMFPIFAVMAGIGEETLFRGALQPRFGIVVTAALFAFVHVQYGVTPILGMVFVHGLAYGLIRRHLNTTTAVLAHAYYDLGAYLPIGLVFGALNVMFLSLVLAVPAWRNRELVWRTLRQGFIDDWTRFAPLDT